MFSVLILVQLLSLTMSSPPCGNLYGQAPCIYLPAKPGQTPACANPGNTFCEKINDYPVNLIKTLLKGQAKDFFTDEIKIDFAAKKRLPYEKFGSHPYGPYNSGSYESSGDYYGNHNKPNYNNQRPQVSWQHNPYSVSTSKSEGYHYPNPGTSSSSNFFDVSKPSSFNNNNNNYGDYYRRSSKKRRSTDEASKIILDDFIKNIAPRNKRQISPNREELCEIRTNYINPQAALNARGNWMYIVNGVETATQLVRTETCASQVCSNLCTLPNNYNSRCEQKYVQKRLVALDSRGENFYTDTFWFPSCCVCTLSTN